MKISSNSFLSLWLVNVTTTLAIELFAITVLVSVYMETSSTFQAAGVMVARMLPLFFLGPVAGVVVDRFSRKSILISMGVFQSLLAIVTLLYLFRAGTLSVVTIFFLLAGLAAADAFHRPARTALIPVLVDQGYLVKANSFILASNQIMMGISYTAGGWLILSFSLLQITFGVLALFVLAIGMAICIVLPAQPVAHVDKRSQESAVRSWVIGWRYLREHALARPLTIMETVEHLPHGIWTGALMLAFTVEALKGNAVEWGYQATAYFSGMIVGSIGAMFISKPLASYPGKVIVVNAWIAGVLTLLYAESATVWMAVMWAFVFGPFFAIRDVAQDSLLQSSVAIEQLGRVYATREMLRSAMFMFAGLFFAWLSSFVDIRTIYIIGGVLYLLTGVYAFGNKALRESRLESGVTDGNSE